MISHASLELRELLRVSLHGVHCFFGGDGWICMDMVGQMLFISEILRPAKIVNIPIIYKVWYISGGAGFLPSTVSYVGIFVPLGSNPFCKWFRSGFWVPKHLLTGYLEHKGVCVCVCLCVCVCVLNAKKKLREILLENPGLSLTSLWQWSTWLLPKKGTTNSLTERNPPS